MHDRSSVKKGRCRGGGGGQVGLDVSVKRSKYTMYIRFNGIFFPGTMTGCTCFSRLRSRHHAFDLLSESSILVVLSDRMSFPVCKYVYIERGLMFRCKGVCDFIFYFDFSNEITVRVVCKARLMNRTWVTKIFNISSEVVLNEVMCGYYG